MKYQAFGLNSKNLAILCILVFICGCGTSATVKQARRQALEAYELQKPIVVRTSENDGRPEWTKKTVFEEDGKMCFSGAFLNGADYPLSVRAGNAEALKVAVQTLSQFIRTEFSEYTQGTNDAGDTLDRYVQDGIATFTRSLHVQGVRQAEVYYEEVFSVQAMRPVYNVWCKLTMKTVDYLAAKAEALRRLRDRFGRDGNVEAKEKAERMLEELKGEI